MADNIGQKIGAYQPSKTVWFWSVAGAVVLTMIVGFTWGGWVTGGGANERAEVASKKAVAELAAGICVHQFLQAGDAGLQLAELKETSSYQRDTFLEKAGWVTFAGAEKPVAGAGDLCADLLMDAEVQPVTTPVATPVAEAEIVAP
jgi:hypothetical protein